MKFEEFTLYQPNYYDGWEKDKIKEDIRELGFDPHLIQDPPNYIYPTHQHPERKLLVFLEGSMEVRVNTVVYQCNPFDKLIIDGNLRHNAVVGKDGCTFYWSEKK